MKLTTLIVFITLFTGQNILASPCPTLTGDWLGGRYSSPLIFIRQTACSDLVMETNGFKMSLKVDGSSNQISLSPAGIETVVRAEFKDDALVLDYFSSKDPHPYTLNQIAKETYRLTNQGRTLEKRWASIDEDGREDEVVTGTLFKQK